MEKTNTKPIAVVLSILFLIGLFVIIFKPGGEFGLTAAGDTIYFTYFLLASIIGFWAFKYYTWKASHGKMIFFLSLGMFLSFIAGFILWYYEIISRLPYPYPSLADYAWVAAYIPMLIAVVYGIFTIKETLNIKKLVMPAFAWLILLFFTTKYLLIPIIMDAESPLIEKFFNFIYPFTDLVLVLGIAILVIGLLGGALSKAWAFILAGMGSYYLGDIAFSYLIWNGLYYTGSPTDLFWWGGGLLIAFGFYYSRKLIESKV